MNQPQLFKEQRPIDSYPGEDYEFTFPDGSSDKTYKDRGD
ncbi:hypothetical protein TNCT_506271, partial [Trichonephila clavata]